jgi:hypothetical protein
MFRWAIVALALLAPAAMSQEGVEEGRKLAGSLTQADVDTLGACQARVEGMGTLVDAFQDWLQQQGYTEQLAGIRDARAKGVDLVTTFEELRTLLGSEAGGFDLGASERARTAMATNFQRRPDESDLDTYNRWQAQTKLPQDCSIAMKRAHWRVALAQLDKDE